MSVGRGGRCGWAPSSSWGGPACLLTWGVRVGRRRGRAPPQRGWDRSAIFCSHRPGPAWGSRRQVDTVDVRALPYQLIPLVDVAAVGVVHTLLRHSPPQGAVPGLAPVEDFHPGAQVHVPSPGPPFRLRGRSRAGLASPAPRAPSGPAALAGGGGGLPPPPSWPAAPPVPPPPELEDAGPLPSCLAAPHAPPPPAPGAAGLPSAALAN